MAGSKSPAGGGASHLFIIGFWAGILRFSLGCLLILRGQVKFPTGGIPDRTQGAAERPTLVWNLGGVSKSEMPEPTVLQSDEEDKTDIAVMAPADRPLHTYLCLPFHALILVLVLFRVLP